jgi:hypothetical protein
MVEMVSRESLLGEMVSRESNSRKPYMEEALGKREGDNGKGLYPRRKPSVPTYMQGRHKAIIAPLPSVLQPGPIRQPHSGPLSPGG